MDKHYTIPDSVLDKIVEHRPHLNGIVANLRAALSEDAAHGIEKTLADAYLCGETQLTASETSGLAACSAGHSYPRPLDSLRARRLALGLSQAALARELGVSPHTVAVWERGEQRIEHPEMLDKAIRHLEERLLTPPA